LESTSASVGGAVDEGGDGGGIGTCGSGGVLCGREFAMMAVSRSHSGLNTEAGWRSRQKACGGGDGDGDGDGDGER
jgi:hypothetical protein